MVSIEDTFEFLALPHLQQLSIPSVECVHDVSSALDVLAQRMAHAVFRRFPRMAEAWGNRGGTVGEASTVGKSGGDLA